jgi:ribonucleoside-diphosphate reductase alpha chain
MSEREVYEYSDVYESSLAYFRGDVAATELWISHYALKDGQGSLYERTPDDMHHRIAKELGRVEHRYARAVSSEEFYELMKGFRYVLPHGSLMSEVGNTFHIGPLSNDYVTGSLGASDSYGAIFRTDEEQVQLMKRRSGVSHDVSSIRPQGFPVKGSSLTSSGLLPFVRRYVKSYEEVLQGSRRNALLLSSSVRHPDVYALVGQESESLSRSGVGFSVRLTDDFMRSVSDGGSYCLRYPTSVVDSSAAMTRTVDARSMWKGMLHTSRCTGNPMYVFWDNVLKEAISGSYASDGLSPVALSASGGDVMGSYEGTRMVSLNLLSYVEDAFVNGARINYDLLRRHIGLAIRMLDDMVDLELEKLNLILIKVASDPEPEEVKRRERELWEKVKRSCESGRRVSLSVTGEADMMAAMNVRYGSHDAELLSEEVHRFIAIEGYRASVALAKERGAFPSYKAESERKSTFIQRIARESPDLLSEMEQWGRRSVSLLSVADEEDVSLLAGVCSGMNPSDGLLRLLRQEMKQKEDGEDENTEEERNQAKECQDVELSPMLLRWGLISGHLKEGNRRMSLEQGSLLLSESPYASAVWLPGLCQWRIRQYGMVQKWVDGVVEPELRLPPSADESLLSEYAMEAWRTGCKTLRIAVRHAPVSLERESAPLARTTERPVELSCDVVRFQNNKERWIAFVGLLDGRPYEIFTGLSDEEDGIMLPKSVTSGSIIKSKDSEGRSRYDFQFTNKRGYKTTIEGLSQKFDHEYWNYAKLISGVLRYGMPIDQVLKLVAGLQLNNESINTWKVGVERALKKYVTDDRSIVGQVCPNCGNYTLTLEGGSIVCKSCGYNRNAEPFR